MPHVNLEETTRKNEKLQTLLHGTMRTRGMTFGELAGKMGVTNKTISGRFKNPENLTVGELLKLSRILDIPIEDIRQSIQL